jgi:hypothetical protein
MSSYFSENIWPISVYFTIVYSDNSFAENPEKFLEDHLEISIPSFKSISWLGLLLFQVQPDDGILIATGPI